MLRFVLTMHGPHALLLVDCTSEYLNEVFSLNLWPGDPYEKAKQQIILADFSSKVV